MPTKPYPRAPVATFPPDLLEPYILAVSAPGDIVLDPSFGSGTVAEVCIKHERRFVGIEINPEDIELAGQRLNWEIVASE